MPQPFWLGPFPASFFCFVMASQVCNALTKNVASRKCLTAGGIKTRVWACQAEDFTGAKTYNTGGALSSFALETGAAVIKFKGRARKGSGGSKLSQPVDGAVNVEQTLILEAAYGSQAEANAIMAFLRADGKSIFVETNAGTIRQYFADFGHESMEGEEGTGTLIGDPSGVLKITLKGNEPDLPKFFEAVISGQMTQLASSVAYLDALVTGTDI